MSPLGLLEHPAACDHIAAFLGLLSDHLPILGVAVGVGQVWKRFSPIGKGGLPIAGMLPCTVLPILIEALHNKVTGRHSDSKGDIFIIRGRHQGQHPRGGCANNADLSVSYGFDCLNGSFDPLQRIVMVTVILFGWRHRHNIAPPVMEPLHGRYRHAVINGIPQHSNHAPV